LSEPLLSGTVMRLHLGEHLVHLAEKPNSVGNQIWIPVAFVPLDKFPLLPNALALVGDVLSPDINVATKARFRESRSSFAMTICVLRLQSLLALDACVTRHAIRDDKHA
jgi:hypothetical protein